MCEFIGTEHVMHGKGCCKCRAYNGLQRIFCKDCGSQLHQVEVPADVIRCKNCGFGLPAEFAEAGPWLTLEDKMKGERPDYLCPSCDAPMGPLLN